MQRIGIVFAVLTGACLLAQASAGERIFVWPDMAPGETQNDEGITQPPKAGEDPPVTRVTHIRRPAIDVFLADKPNGSAVVVLPGGGFAKVVPDKEGSEAAPWLNALGISVFVLNYRTNEVTPKSEQAWRRPLQDAQRTLRLIRHNATDWKVDPAKVGVLGFSAGGQVAAILHTAEGEAAYEQIDDIDKQNYGTDFSMLIYPWRIQNAAGELLADIKPAKTSPPAFIVHTHDDGSSSVGSVLLYAGLRTNKVPAELHVYENGGHGYGMRPVANSEIGTWPQRATPWLQRHHIATP
jgi:acetyl esterase/lipase